MSQSGDYRLFIKVHNGFPEHRKTVGLSDRAFRNLVELWCYCSRNLTDGRVPKPYGNKILSRKSREELLSALYMIERDSEYEMLDYLEHQMSAADVADLREKRARAGSKGGKSKASGVASAIASAVANAKQTASKNVADLDIDVDKDKDNYPVVTTRRPTSTRAPLGTRLPQDWTPSPRLTQFVATECPSVDGRTETANFIDYWHSKVGRDSTKADWDATYRKWMRTAQERSPRIRQQTPGRVTTDQRFVATLDLSQRLAQQEAANVRQIGAGS